MVDLNQLDDGEKQMLLQYLQEEYDKHPEQFPFPKEHLSKIVEQENFDLLRDQIRILQQQKGVQQDTEEDQINPDAQEAPKKKKVKKAQPLQQPKSNKKPKTKGFDNDMVQYTLPPGAENMDPQVL